MKDVYKPSNIFLHLCTATKIKSITREFLEYLPFCRIIFHSEKLSSCPSKLLLLIDIFIQIEQLNLHRGNRRTKHPSQCVSRAPAADRPQNFNIFTLFKHGIPRKVCTTRGAKAICGFREVTDNLLLQQPIVNYYNLKPFSLHNCSSFLPISLSKQCKFIIHSWENEVQTRRQL